MKDSKDKILIISIIGFCLLLVMIYQMYSTIQFYTKKNTIQDNNTKLAIYIDNEKSDTFPGKNDGYVFEKAECTEGATGSWDNDSWSFITSNLTKTTECNLYFKVQNITVEKEENMIPIMWDGSKWVKADEGNSETYKWYDYDNFQWANIVLVNDTSRDNYKNSTAGTPVLETDILAYFVYVPRYRYKLFNANNQGVPVQTIEVEFETKDTARSTGTTNGTWLTHPAFCFGRYDETTGICDGDEVNGLWIGKFTTSPNPGGVCYTTPNTTNCNVNATSNTPTIKPNQDMWRYINVSQAFTVSKYFKTNAMYGLSSSTIDSHMMKNMEWGAVAYLSQSRYGKRDNPTYSSSETNRQVYKNNYRLASGDYYRTLTGCSSGKPANTTTVTTCTNTYESSPSGTGASTTGTIYGIYDMNGGSYQYVMGNMASDTEGTTFNPGSATSGAGSFNPNPPETKYFDIYKYGTTNTDAVAFARGKLGDATREILTATSGYNSSWYSAYSGFPYSTIVWFIRGGNADGSGSNTGVFFFGDSAGGTNSNNSFRAVLAK